MVLLYMAPFILLAKIIEYIFPSKKRNVVGKHVVITGGSSGIGKSAALWAAKHGAHVTIIARNENRLTDALNEIKSAVQNKEQKITKVSCDVTDLHKIENTIKELEKNIAPIYMLVNCAGMAICGQLEDISIPDVKKMIDVNYLGTLYPTRVVVPLFKARKEGIIVITASQASLMGIFGLSVYSSCKFALRGLAESLAMELKAYGVSVTLAMPPDTDTPGFENENKSKPEETKLISESGGLYKPDQVANRMMNDALNKTFFSVIGMESYILTILCTGMSPVCSISHLLIECTILGFLRMLGAFYLWTFNKIIYEGYEKRTNTNNSNTR